MSISSLHRFLSHQITSKTPKFSTLRYTTSSLPDELYSRLLKNPTNIERALNSIKDKLDSACVIEVMNKCSLNNSRIGLRFFVWAGSRSNYRHSDFMYSKAYRLFKIKQNPQVVLDLIEAFRSEKCAVTVKTIIIFLNLCKQGNLADEALLVLRKMPQFGLRPDAIAYNIVIRLFCSKGDMDTAQKLMGEMGLIDLYPDMVTYISMIKGFCDIGRVEEARGLLMAMGDHGCVPNVVAYSAILDGVCKFGSVERALDVLLEMEREGGNCNPNVLTYTSIIQRLCEKGRAMDAFAILDRMEANGCAPNRVTVSTLLKGLCMDGLLEEANKLIDRVVAGGSVSYGDCCNFLVVCLIRIKKIEEAEKHFWKMLVSGLKPDGLACSLMIKELCFNKRVLDGYHLYDKIEQMGLMTTMDSDMYSILLAGLCQQCNTVEAVKLARSMLKKRIRLEHPYVNNILHHLKEFGNTELVTEFGKIGR